MCTVTPLLIQFFFSQRQELGVPSGAQQRASPPPTLWHAAVSALQSGSAELELTLIPALSDLQLCLSDPLCSRVHHRYWSTADLELSLPVLFRLLGLRMSLSSMLTICPNLGLSLRSFCQQSNISWWRAMGQSIGGGSRYPSSMALITYKWHN